MPIKVRSDGVEWGERSGVNFKGFTVQEDRAGEIDVSLGGSLSATGQVTQTVGDVSVSLADYSQPTFPTVEEMYSTRTIEATITSAGGAVVKPIFTAPFPLRIRDIWVTNFGGALTLDGSNNWSFRARRYRVVSNFAADFADILDSSGTNWSWNLSAVQGASVRWYGVTYDASTSLFRTGDVLALRIAPTGSPTSLSELCVTVRWEPI